MIERVKNGEWSISLNEVGVNQSKERELHKVVFFSCLRSLSVEELVFEE